MSKVCKNGPQILIPHPDTCNATWLISFLCAYLHTLPFSPQSQQLIHIQKSMDDSGSVFFIGGFGIIFKRNTLPPGVFTKKKLKKTHPFVQNTNPGRGNDARNAHLIAAFVPPFGCPLGSKVRKHQASGWKMRLSGIPRCFFEDHETKVVNLV